MSRLFLPGLAICLIAATAAQAQYGGGGGGGHGHRGGGGRGRSPSSSAPAATPDPTSIPRQTPVNQIEIVGVVRAIDAASGRVTIAYNPVEELDWPAGTMPFMVSKAALLNGVTVGEKVRFRLESHQISDLKPY